MATVSQYRETLENYQRVIPAVGGGWRILQERHDFKTRLSLRVWDSFEEAEKFMRSGRPGFGAWE